MKICRDAPHFPVFTGNNKYIREFDMVYFHLNFINEWSGEYFSGIATIRYFTGNLLFHQNVLQLEIIACLYEEALAGLVVLGEFRSALPFGAVPFKVFVQ